MNVPLPQETRPISIPNTDNRIISFCVQQNLQPCLNSFLLPQQKAFLHGRRINANIEDFNQRFYYSLSRRQQHLLLLVDFQKAYDSVDHTFLFKLVEYIGLPWWLCNIVKMLLTNLRVRFTPPFDTYESIPVTRGVKQGCPLAPLLFLLLIDPIISQISDATSAVEIRAFADDIGISIPGNNFMECFPFVT
ncbi:MAG: reverse transcriptase domain-containing protein, partial [Pirellulaceae bacterium]